MISRPRSRDSSALKFIFPRSWSWSRDLSPKVLVSVSRPEPRGLGLEVSKKSWQQHCCRKKLSSPRPITVSVGCSYYDCDCKANFTSDLLTWYSIVLYESFSFCPDLCLRVENSVPRSRSRDLKPKISVLVSRPKPKGLAWSWSRDLRNGLDNNTESQK